ncbi:TPA: 16S rRNA (cytosine(1402)-N(4))-methyltransferase RsmH [Candidatus Poribacteria bacterium]|nr:16S rRNA (cytosine(1402)-N(4))-methyltransferase RsmH [Candidatus Poribacteria bacterium]
MSSYDRFHIPVLLDEVMCLLNPKDGGIYVDCTLGAGGHAERILQLSSPGGRLIGIDLDSEAISIARERLKRFGDRVSFVHANFADLDDILRSLGLEGVDGVLMDLGVSWIQLSDPKRGFSFRMEAPLDMRMDRRAPLTAYEVVNTKSERELREIFRKYGEERWAGRIARRIVRCRERSPILTTKQLARIVESAVTRRGRIHPATRVFQALRIYVNGELDNLERGLDSAIRWLKPGGRICVISFHSLEDRIVKWKFRGMKAHLRIITPKPITPGGEEVKENPRSRSAKLRAAEAI